MQEVNKALKNLSDLKSTCKLFMVNSDNTYYRDELIDAYYKKLFKDQKFLVDDVILSDCDISTVENSIKMKSLTCENKVIVISYTQKDLNKKFTVTKPKKKTITYEEKLIEAFKSTTNPVTIFLLPDKFDKRKQMDKHVEKHGIVVEFKPIDEKEMVSFINDYFKGCGVDVDGDAIKLLTKLLHPDLYLVKNELDKLCMYDNHITKEIVSSLVTKSSEVIIYDLIESISVRNKKKSLLLLDECLSGGTSEFQVLSLLIRNFRYLNYATIYQKDFVSVSKLPSFIASKYLDQSKKFKKSSIKRILELIIEVEIGLKTGLDKSMLMEYMVIKMCEGK